MPCHGNFNSSKRSHLSGQTHLLEDIAVDTFVHSSFGPVVMPLLHGLFTGPSWHTLTALACGWALATDRYTITTSLWLTGAAAIKHCSRFSGFLGGPLSQQRGHLWGAVSRLAAQLVPPGAVVRVSFDDTTQKKAGHHLAGLARYRHGAGSARQAYRTLRGVNCVLGGRHIPLPRWPGPSLRIPIGLELYLQAPHASQLHVPSRARRQWARDILDCLATQLPRRSMQSLADGGDATQDDVRRLPKAVPIVGRFPMSAKLYDVPPPHPPQHRGAPRKKGARIGSPTTLAQTATGWSPHPSGRRAPSRGWPVARCVAGAPRAGRRPATAGQRHHHPASPQKTTLRHRSLLHHRSLLERGRDRTGVWPPLGGGNCHP